MFNYSEERMLNTDVSYAEKSLKGRTSYSETRFSGVVKELFPRTYVLLPQINQIYELDLAWGEYNRLDAAGIVARGAYFRSVEGVDTNHYQICMRTPDQVNASARQDRKNFFAANVFAVGYATHGLFPYRGKFHPQMVKAILNIMGLKPGNAVLDPMAGCGTTAIEASIMGIDSFTNELSPFACLMTRAKVGVLNIDCGDYGSLRVAAKEIYDKIEGTFAKIRKRPGRLSFDEVQAPLQFADPSGKHRLISTFPDPLRELFLLCFLDSVGYAERRANKTPRDLFPDVLGRYLDAVEAFNESRRKLGLKIGKCTVLEGDARDLALDDNSVDGVLFSPPYSFAIDYLENDRPQLELLGIDIDQLRPRMVGLRGEGRNDQQRIEARLREYFADMRLILAECHRVLRPGCYCTVIVGSNTNQTGGITLEDRLIELAEPGGLKLDFQIMREIEGIRNTMREEYLLFFKKV
jgi:SAM-dependent methyltransferase